MNKIDDMIQYLADYNGIDLKLMEVCGTHTTTIAKNEIRSLISPKIKLCSGPGCPVCVTTKAYIDRLCEYALKEGYIVTSFGDMLKVPGQNGNLTEAKARGGKVEVFYSPFEVIEKAKRNPDSIYVVAAVGFETTVPIYGLMLETILKEGLENIKFLTALKRMVPVLRQLNDEENTIDGFIAPGHVSAIMGSKIYETLTQTYHKPFAVTGFTAEAVLIGIMDLVWQCQNGRAEVHNLYSHVVKEEGNSVAQNKITDYFEEGSADWRGIGSIAQSGFYLKSAYIQYDLGSRGLSDEGESIKRCVCTEIIKGKRDPWQCPYFGKQCTPLYPIGPCMVSAEGACGVWFKERGF